MGIDKITREASRLVGKSFTTDSLRREVNRIMPDAWWGSAPTPRGLCIYAEKDGTGLSIQLDRTERKNRYRVRKINVGNDE
jgi:hypothetical protein